MAVIGLLLGTPPSALAATESVLLVVAAARDTTAGFRSQVLPAQGRRALTWPHGVITLPDTVAWLEHGELGLAFRLDATRLEGVGEGGRFRGEPGRYDIDTPLYLGDERIVALLADGRLEVSPGFIVYHVPEVRRDPRGDYLLVGGLVVATAVLLRAARRRSRRA